MRRQLSALYRIAASFGEATSRVRGRAGATAATSRCCRPRGRRGRFTRPLVFGGAAESNPRFKSAEAMRYSVDKSCVTHDRLEDEVIIINVATGSYSFWVGTGRGIFGAYSFRVPPFRRRRENWRPSIRATRATSCRTSTDASASCSNGVFFGRATKRLPRWLTSCCHRRFARVGAFRISTNTQTCGI